MSVLKKSMLKLMMRHDMHLPKVGANLVRDPFTLE